MRTVVCFGDSNTWGTDPAGGGRLATDIRWTGRLAANLGNEWRILEEGLQGRTSVYDDPTAEYRNGRDYLLPCLWSHAPVDVVTIMLGTNDLRLGKTATEIASAMDLLVGLARRSLSGPDETSPAVLLMAPAPILEQTPGLDAFGYGPAEAATSRLLAPLYRQIADRHRCAFLDVGQLVSPSPADGLHFDAQGHAQLGDAVAAKLHDLLDP